MVPLSTDTWLLAGAVAGLCLIAFLYALATLYRDQTMVHDLKVRVHDLRREYAERLARQQAEREEAEAESIRSASTSPSLPLSTATPRPPAPAADVAGRVGPSPASRAAA